MRSWLVALVLAVGVFGLTGATPTGAQEVVSVSVVAAEPGTASQGCTAGPQLVTSPPQFVLTRTGDTTGTLDVTISWDGEIASATTVSPTVVEFAAGASTATITPGFASDPTVVGTLSLTVESGGGYQPGDPATADAVWQFVEPSCVAPLPPAPPPIVTTPSFTG